MDTMSTWNYRIMKHKVDLSTLSDSLRKLLENQDDNYWYGIHEVYYDENGKVDGWTDCEIQPFGETPEELKQCFELMSLSFNKEILDYEESDSIPDFIVKDESTDEDKRWGMSIMKEHGIIE